MKRILFSVCFAFLTIPQLQAQENHTYNAVGEPDWVVMMYDNSSDMGEVMDAHDA